MWSNERENKVFRKDMYRLSVRCRTTNKMLGTTPGDPELLRSYIASKAPSAKSKAEELALTYEQTGGDIPDDELKRAITIFPIGRFLRRVDDPAVFYDPMFDAIPKVKLEECYVPFIWDYQLRGSFKESISFIQKASKPKKSDVEPEGDAAPKKRGAKKAGKFACTNITAFKKDVDGGWFIRQRRIPLLVPPTYINEMGEEVSTYENGSLRIWSRQLRADTAQGPRICLAASQFVPAGTEFYYTIELLNDKNKDALLECLDFKEKVGMLQWRGAGNGTLIWTPGDEEGHPIDEIP